MTIEKNKAPVPTGSQLPAVPQDYGEFTGKGFEGTSAADYAIPYLLVLQDGNPEVKKAEADYVPGAEPGMLFNSVTKRLYPGNTGVIFVPVITHHEFVEWARPRGKGGPIGKHNPQSEVVHAAKADAEAKKKKFGVYSTPEGNDLAETFYMFGMLLENPDDTSPEGHVVMALSSTKITPYKEIMPRLRAIKGPPPLFSNRLRITTVFERREAGNSFNIKITPLIDNDVVKSQIPSLVDGQTNPLLIVGHELYEMVKSGAAHTADEPQRQNREGGDSMIGPDGKPLF